MRLRSFNFVLIIWPQSRAYWLYFGTKNSMVLFINLSDSEVEVIISNLFKVDRVQLNWVKENTTVTRLCRRYIMNNTYPEQTIRMPIPALACSKKNEAAFPTERKFWFMLRIVGNIQRNLNTVDSRYLDLVYLE